jgi:spermidine synthase
MGVGNLYTRETYIHARERLKEDGMVVQWLALHQFSPDNLRILVNTFRSAFPFVYMWEKWHYVALVGTKNQFRIDFQKFKDAFANRSIKADLEKWKLNDPDIFLSSFLMGPEGVRKFAQDAPLNTEDRPRIEFSNMKVSKAAYSYMYAEKNLSALLKLRESPFPYIYNISDVERRKLKKDFENRRYLLLKHIRRLR